MASRSAGDISLRFTLENAEVVRKALTDLGKDGEKALKQFDRSAQPATASSKALAAAMSSLQGQARTFASHGGIVSTTIAGIGPAGLAGAAAIGATVFALSKLIDGVNALADKAGRLRDFSETVGLTVTQVQALEIVGADVGLSSDKLAVGITKLTSGMEELRRGTGSAFDTINRIDPALARQLASARDTAAQIDILARTWAAADLQQRNALSRAVFGRAGADLGRLLAEIAGGGGLGALETRVEKSIVLTADLAIKLDDLRDAGQRLKTSAGDRFFGIFAERVLSADKAAWQYLDNLSIGLKRISEINISESVLKFLALSVSQPFGAGGAAWEMLFNSAPKTPAAPNFGQAPPNFGTEQREGDMRRRRSPTADQDDEKTKLTAEFLLNVERERMAVLGQAATAEDKLKLKRLELAVATNDWTRFQEEGTRALSAHVLAEQQADTATRSRLGVITEEQLLNQRLAELQDLRARGLKLSAAEMLDAERMVRKEVRETVEQMEVRRSPFPGLTSFIQESNNLNELIDRGATGSVRQLSSAIVDMSFQWDKAGQHAQQFGMNVPRMVAEIVAQRAIAAPIATALTAGLSSIFGAGGLPGGRPLGQEAVHGGIGSSAYGTDNWRGGLTWVGERGMELVNLPRGSQVVPNHELGGLGGGVTVNLNVHNRAGAAVSAGKPKPSGDGRGIDLEIMIDAVDDALAQRQVDGSGSHARVLKDQFGVSRQF